jgi:uncharacterized delta-60 repeat protein
LTISEEETAMAQTWSSRRLRRRPRVEILENRRLLTAGFLDTTFGGTGEVMTHVGSPTTQSYAVAVAVQPDLKVVAVGHAAVVQKHVKGLVNEIGLVRYNQNGTLDGSFGSGGIATLPANEWLGAFAASALQADGKIVVAIDASVNGSSNTNWELVRFNANGSLDTTFGGSGTGKVITAFPGGYAIPWTIAIQPTDGKIVVVGSAGSGVAVARYTTGGTLDTSFGTGGEVITPIGGSGSLHEESAVAIDSLGRIIVGGVVQGNSAVPALARYNPNGTLDTSFGVGGVQTVSLPPSFPSAATTGLGFQSTGSDAGKIVVSMSGSDLALTRLNPDGSLDGSFGSGGFYEESRMSNSVGLSIQPDDKLIIAGQGANVYVVTRVLADGSSYDPSFGSAGLGQTNFGAAGENPEALAPDGKIVLAGSSDSNFATERFLGDPLATTTTLTSSLNPSTYGQSVTFTATVTVSYSYDVATGTVSFYDGSTLLGSGTLSTANGVTTATFTTASLAVGTHSITATYSGDSNDLPSTSAVLSQTVNPTAMGFMSAITLSSSRLAVRTYGPAQGAAPSSTGSLLAPLVLDDPVVPTGPMGGKHRRLS